MSAEPATATRRTPARPTRTAPYGFWRRLLPFLAAVALASRLPSFLHPFWSPDEGYLAVQARILASGGELYETVVDRKPPLLPWLYEAAFTLFGDGSAQAMKLLAIAAQFTTAALLAAVARRRWGDRSGVTAGVLFLLISVGFIPQDTQAVTFEVVILPCTVAAVLCADRGRWGAAGVAVAGAFLTKQTGGVVLVPVLWLLWQATGPGPSLRPALLRTGAGFAAPVAAAALLTDPWLRLLDRHRIGGVRLLPHRLRTPRPHAGVGEQPHPVPVLRRHRPTGPQGPADHPRPGRETSHRSLGLVRRLRRSRHRRLPLLRPLLPATPATHRPVGDRDPALTAPRAAQTRAVRTGRGLRALRDLGLLRPPRRTHPRRTRRHRRTGTQRPHGPGPRVGHAPADLPPRRPRTRQPLSDRSAFSPTSAAAGTAPRSARSSGCPAPGGSSPRRCGPAHRP